MVYTFILVALRSGDIIQCTWKKQPLIPSVNVSLHVLTANARFHYCVQDVCTILSLSSDKSFWFQLTFWSRMLLFLLCKIEIHMRYFRLCMRISTRVLLIEIFVCESWKWKVRMCLDSKLIQNIIISINSCIFSICFLTCRDTLVSLFNKYVISVSVRQCIGVL